MGVHVRGTDGDIAAYSLGRVHVGVVGAVVAPFHPQHRILHRFGFDDSITEATEGVFNK